MSDVKNVDEFKKEFVEMCGKLQKLCGSVHPDACKKGRCPYTHKEFGCWTEALGMRSPYDWEDMEAADDI